MTLSKRVIIQKPDLDTCLAALLLRVSQEDDIVVVNVTEASDILDPNVLCIEAGGSGEILLNNFDHHNTDKRLPPACRQVYQQKMKERGCSFPPNLSDLVEYVCMVDERPSEHPSIPFPSLSNIFSGMLLVESNRKIQFLQGIAILKKVLAECLNPFETLPEINEWHSYIEAKIRNQVLVTDMAKNAGYYTSSQGKRIAFSESEAIGGIGALYAQGCDVVILFNPSFGNPSIQKFTIAGNNIRVYDLVEKFNTLESGWGGSEMIIGSPRAGTHLIKEHVLKKVLEGL